MSTKILCLYLVFQIVSFSLLAQSTVRYSDKIFNDSLIKKNELRFVCSKEEEIFRKYQRTKKLDDGIRLVFASTSDLKNAENALKILYEEKQILQSKISKLKEIKKVEYINKYLDNRFLDKFESNAFLPKIFENKSFNQVAAGLIYAWFFENLNIPYEARVSTINTYLIAYPNTFSIVIKPFKDWKNLYVLKENYQINFIDENGILRTMNLNQMKNIPEFEIYTNNFFTEYSANFDGLISAHYQNLAFYNADFLSQYEKAFLYYAISMCLHTANGSVNTIVELGKSFLVQEISLNPLSIAYVTSILSRSKDISISPDILPIVFNNLSKEFTNSKNFELYDSTFNLLNSFITDADIAFEMKFIYFKTYVLSEIKSENYQQAYNNALKILALDVDNEKVLDFISDFYLYYSNFVTKTEEKEITIEKLNYMMEFAPKLNNYFLLQLDRLNFYCDLAENSYKIGDIKTGDFYLKKIEDFEIPENMFFEEKIVNVYVSASFWFYKKNNNKLAKQYIERGLAKYPNSYELKRRLRAF